MPAILTHYTFATLAEPRENNPLYFPLTNLGAQGPDTFMAYGSVPWIKRGEKAKIQGFGHAMHKIDVAETYLKMAKYALEHENSEPLYAFLDGLLMHYCLDGVMHAYIFYRSGFDENGQLTGYYSWSHGFFEAILDKVYAKRKGTYQKLSKCIICNDELVKEASKMWAACSPTPLGEDDFYNSYKDFVAAENLLWNPRGIKLPLFRLIGKYSTPHSQCHPKSIAPFEAIDVTNDKHSEWMNPATGEVHNENVDEMFEIALNDFAKAHALIVRFRNGEDIEKEFYAFTNNWNHEGIPVGMKNIHQNLCWEVLKKPKYLPPKKK